MKVAILCGGRGLRFGDTEIPKPMQLVGGRPLVWHIMRWYAAHGHREFVLCLGWRGDVIREWAKLTERHHPDSLGAEVNCLDTGLDTATGGRLLRVREHLGDEFMVTYGDCLSDVHLPALLEFDRSHGRVATVTCIQPQLPWGVCDMNLDGGVHRFQEKPRYRQWCNGGFMVADSRLFGYIDGDDTPLETALARMAEAGELHGFKHGGFWHSCDTEKDRQELEALWNQKGARWAA